MRRFSGIQSVAFGFIVLLLEIVADGCVGRILYLDDEAEGRASLPGRNVGLPSP